MKLFVFLLGIAIGAVGYHYYNAPAADASTPAPATDHRSVAERVRDGAVAARDAVAQKLSDWNLTPETIDRELRETGRVVRSKTANVGQTMSDARIATVINAKYTLDRDLSARTIDVDADNGRVTLRGTAASRDLIARAIGLALETDGVTTVDSELTVSAK
jgi:hypothetical protein